jgi:hypothetical protein
MVSRLKRGRLPADDAENRLLEFEQAQLARIEHRDRVAATLARSPHQERLHQATGMGGLR